MIHSANPTVNRREERLLRERLAAMDVKVDRLVKEVGAVAPAFPTPTADTADTFDDYDVQFLAESLAEDHSWLPHGSHVEVQATDVTSPLQLPHGRVYTNLATSISIPIIGAFTPRALLETGLVTKGGKFQAHVFERLLSEVPGMVKGRLIGPRELMMARQEAGKRARPGLWSA